MIEAPARPHSLVDNWRQLRGLLATSGPAELQEFRESNLRRFEEAGFPGKHEEYKYVSLRAVEEASFEPAYGATVSRGEIAKAPLGDLDAITVAFVNGQYAPELSSYEVERDGLYVGPLEDAWDAHGEFIRRHFGKIATLEGKLGSSNDERFVWLNNAYASEGAFIYIPREMTLDRPIHLVFAHRADHGPFAAFPRVLIVLEGGAQAKVVESYLGLGGTYFVDAVSEVVLGPDAILEHTLSQHETPDAFHLKTVATHQEQGSVYTSNNINFGGRIVRNELNVWIEGEHTETWLNGANLGVDEQVVDNHTRIDHAKPNCNSFEVYKSILRDRALGVFNGKIFVYEDAQKTDAKQTNQGILLSPTAIFNTKPQLEIFADDVKCTHGATVGQLREDAMFYLRARGIPHAEAQAMLVYAFAAEVMEKISIEAARNALEKLLFEKLEGSEAP